MPANLIIVESPAKASTIKKYLGKDFEVLASYGHVRDLIPKNGAVDPEHNFAMQYATIEKSAKHVDAIAKALKKADTLYLATDPDREGEAISWHLYELLKEKKALKNKTIYRVVFHEITRGAVQAAVANPRQILMSLVDAQQARRALDYLVGFKLSPLLWKKIRRGLSAGRVQSPALRMIVEREEEIEKFIKQEYWSIIADTKSNHEQKPQFFTAKLIEYQKEKLHQFSITNQGQSAQIESVLLSAAQGKLLVSKVTKKQRKRNPAPPFITSTLQQEAGRKLGFTAQRTMRTAQQLYEAGHISYMRTDSVNLSQDALLDIRELIEKRYGKENLPEQPCLYKTKSKNAQEAHEAIRPTSAKTLPEIIKSDLSIEQFKLYDLIWKRTIACQMIHATLNTVSVDLRCGEDNCFRANGSTITHLGFMAVYQEGRDDIKTEENNDEVMLPVLEEGEYLDLLKLNGHQHFTEPPPRYTEASLVKTLEEHSIGRPSTYATIISTLQTREYVVLETKRFHPTDVGRIVNKFLTQYFSQYVDYDFTARLEDELDEIARGEINWIPVLDKFWRPFQELLGKIETEVDRKDITQEAIDEACPECGKPLSIRLGRNGRFIGCTTYPECKYTRNLTEDATSAAPTIVEGRFCPECQAQLVIKQGRYGKFIGCSNYPTCKHMEPVEKPVDTGVVCPECKESSLLKRKSRFGKLFFSCSSYPKCKYAVWNEPINEPCPLCAWPLLTIKITKRKGKEKVCPQKECGFAESMESEE